MSGSLHGKTLYIDADALAEPVVRLKALASEQRWRILQCLANGSRSIGDLAETLRLPASTVAAHVKILEEAGFVHTELRPATHGLQKVCSRTYDNVVLQLPYEAQPARHSVEVVMPIGAYTAFEVQPTCGLASATSLIGYLDDPLSFYEPDRITAGLIWFRAGFLEYVFPNRLPAGAQPLSLQLSMEICSEAPLHNNRWPSDITLWINGREVGTWTCPSDFGGQRGALTPLWWDDKDSQYGLLKRWTVNCDGAFIDGRPLSNLTIDDLALAQQRVIRVRLGVKPDALHVGGLNLFGHTFGNYPQDLVLRLEYLPGQRSESVS
ncbi:ArsR/SmtB family transcription factor [Kallotenue papyrolyticum]|uniref:ArsR/SmtB family transcription factor n=1 Tax=Kallotenue papyrolyticum TaxID=1325125 RepID=UPI0005B7F23E|nr:ArsR family transcriptional regulator [Kallotenue papyrolyticum]